MPTTDSHVYIITGASQGIGAALAERLARRGAKLVLAARSADKLTAVAEACERAGGKAIAVPTDVTDPQACKRLCDEAVETFGGIDVVVHNAGISMVARFEDVTDVSIFDTVMRVNYLGAVYLTHHALPHVRERKGLFVAVSSLAGKMGLPTRTGYSASKHAMQGFFDSLRIELAGTGTDVLILSPGVVATHIRDSSLGADGTARGTGSDDWQQGASVDEVVDEMVEAIDARKRDVVVPSRMKPVPLLRAVAPGLMDRLIKWRLPGA